jgi:hypothetical protein
MGFGMVNFISVAAEHLLSQYAGHISKVRVWHIHTVCFSSMCALHHGFAPRTCLQQAAIWTLILP